MLARAIAGEAGVPFFYTSGAHRNPATPRLAFDRGLTACALLAAGRLVGASRRRIICGRAAHWGRDTRRGALNKMPFTLTPLAPIRRSKSCLVSHVPRDAPHPPPLPPPRRL
jgi:hypothetical protein